MEAIHQSGLWAVRFLALTLAVTPLRCALRMPKMISVRRILGLAVLAYAVLHFGLYIVDQKLALWHVASEIVSRVYLAIGFVAFCGFCVLGSTSTDRMIARLGPSRWSRLHRFVYVGAVIVTVHFFMQSKLDVTQPIIMAGIFALLLGFRVAQRGAGDLSIGRVALVGAAAALATACGEAAWYAWSAGAPILLVLGANLDFSYTVRPAWFVFGAAMVLLVARLARGSMSGVRTRPLPKPAPAPTR
jgi:sulfoxide reductase heme-binding subunit YedZ